MSNETPAPKPSIRGKSFTYYTSLERQGNRSGILGSPGKPDVRVSAPPEFKGEAGVWTPEDLFVASVEVCLMTTFSALATRRGITVLGYRSRAEGLLEFTDDGHRFTRITIRPTIELDDARQISEAETTIQDAHERCLIGKSMTSAVEIEPTIKVVGAPVSG